MMMTTWKYPGAPWLAALALTLGAGAGACSTATSPYEPAPLEELRAPSPASVRPGDKVIVDAWQHDEISVERIVNENGTVQLPLLGEFRVEGMSETRLQDTLTARYGVFYADPLIAVDIKLSVIVTGAVGNPGRFHIDPGMNFFDALGLAGGEKLEAKRSGVILYRDGKAYKIHMNKAALGTDPANLVLQSGDWIYMPTRFFSVQRVVVILTSLVLVLTIANFFVK